ncbi:MAG: hypothetical protein JSS02_09420 [Planctomycetes bacterium]|nr:hypothetical protein [Planctomycetota bacterium]
MLIVNLQRMIRSCFLVLLAGAILCGRPGFAAAEQEEGAVHPAHNEAEPAKHSVFGDIMQIGGKNAAKADKVASDPRLLPDLEARGASDAPSKKAALAAVPLDQLTPEHRQQVTTLLKSVSFYRRLPKVTFPVEPEVYNYFVAHPDVAVSIWRAMKISKLQMWQTGKAEYEADTGDGSVGALEVLHCSQEKCLAMCDGQYKSPMFTKPIAAKSLLLLQTSFAKQPDGTTHVTHRADLFVMFPSQTIDVVARIFSPLTVKMTDRTFTEVSLFLKMMSIAMSRRPDWVEQITDRMDGVPEVRKDQVMALSSQLYAAYRAREAEMDADDGTDSRVIEADEAAVSRRRRADAATERRSTAENSGTTIRVGATGEK